MADDVLAIEARLKDYISGNLLTLENNIKSFSTKSTESLAKVGKSGKDFGLDLNRVGSSLLSLVNPTTIAIGAIAGTGLAFRKALTDAYNYANQIDDLSQKTGASTGYLQKLDYVGSQVGVNVQSLAMAFKNLSVNIVEASSGTGKSSALLSTLGVQTKTADGNMRSMSEIMSETLKAIADLPDVSTRAAVAQEFFGRSSIELLPVLNQGSAGIETMMKRAEDLGLIIRDDAIRNIDAMGDSLKTMQKATNTAATEILITLAPAITTITNKISEFLAKGNNRKRFDLTSIPTPMADAIMPTGSTSRTPEQIAADIAAQQEKIKKILASKEKGGTKDTETWWQKNRTDVILKEREIQKKQHEDSDKAVDEFIEKNSKRVQSAEEKDLAVISDIRGQRTQMEADYDEIINKNAYAQADLRHKNLLEKTKDFTNAQYDVERIASIDRALIAKKEHDMKINYMQDLAMGFGDTMVMMGLASKASAIEQKRLAQLSAIINTAVAASKANSATPYPPINAALMAIAIAQGLAQVAIIQNQKFAAGTLRAPGGMAMVGEFGPEMMYVPGGARIYNNRETNNMIGGNKSVNITLNVGGGSNMSSRDADRITRSLNDLANGLIEAERHGKLEDFKRVMR